MNVPLIGFLSLQGCSDALIRVLVSIEGGGHAYGCGGVPLPWTILECKELLKIVANSMAERL